MFDKGMEKKVNIPSANVLETKPGFTVRNTSVKSFFRSFQNERAGHPANRGETNEGHAVLTNVRSYGSWDYNHRYIKAHWGSIWLMSQISPLIT